MKTKIIFPLIGCMLCILITNSSFTQVTANRKELNKVYAVYAISENPKNNFTNSDFASTNFSLTVNNKVQKSFAQYFGGATRQIWSNAGINFHSSFYINGALNCALFDKNWHLIYSIKYGAEKDMPADVRKIVKSEYYDYGITMAMEVKINKRDIWVINLKNNTTYLTVRVEEGEMEQVEQFEKAK